MGGGDVDFLILKQNNVPNNTCMTWALDKNILRVIRIIIGKIIDYVTRKKNEFFKCETSKYRVDWTKSDKFPKQFIALLRAKMIPIRP